jgi:hypothetical protein
MPSTTRSTLLQTALEVLPALPSTLMPPSFRFTHYDMILLISRGLNGKVGRDDRIVIRKYLKAAHTHLQTDKLRPLMDHFDHTMDEFIEIMESFNDAIKYNELPTEYLKTNGFENLHEVSCVIYGAIHGIPDDISRLDNALAYIESASADSSHKLAVFNRFEYELHYDEMEHDLLLQSEIYRPLIDYMKWCRDSLPSSS